MTSYLERFDEADDEEIRRRKSGAVQQNESSGTTPVQPSRPPAKAGHAARALPAGPQSKALPATRPKPEYDEDGFDARGFDKQGYDRNGYDKQGYDRKGFNRQGIDRAGYNRSGFNSLGYDRRGFNAEGWSKDGFHRDGFNRAGYDRQGYKRDGFNDRGFHRDGFNQAGFNERGFHRDGFNNDGFNEQGFNRDGFNSDGFKEQGFNRDGYNRDGFNEQGFNANGFNKHGFKKDGFNSTGFNKDGFNAAGFDEHGFNAKGLNGDGWDKDGFNEQGFNADGFNSKGFDKDGFNSAGFNKNGFNADGFDEHGFNAKGLNRDGWDKDGFNEQGFNADGFNRKGFDKDGFNSAGFNKNGFNADGFDEHGFNAKGLNGDGWDKDGFDAEGFDSDGYNRAGLDHEGLDREGYDKDGRDAAGYNRDGYGRDGFNRQGVNRDGYDRRGQKRSLILDVRTALADVGMLTDEFLAAQVALLLCSDGEMVKAMLLDGPPGAGKTFLAKCTAKILGAEFIYMQAHGGTTPEEVLFDANIVNILQGAAGDKEAVKGAKDVIELGFLPTVFMKSQTQLVVALMDELDKSSPKTDDLFLAALQEAEVQVKGYGTIKANLNNLVMFFGKNNRREISEPLMRRCRRHYLSFPEKDVELAILTGQVQKRDPVDFLPMLKEPVGAIPETLAEELIKPANQLRKLFQEEKITKPPATQELMQAGQDVLRLNKWGHMEFSGPVASNWLAGFEDDRKVLNSHLPADALTARLKQAVPRYVPSAPTGAGASAENRHATEADSASSSRNRSVPGARTSGRGGARSGSGGSSGLSPAGLSRRQLLLKVGPQEFRARFGDDALADELAQMQIERITGMPADWDSGENYWEDNEDDDMDSHFR